MVSTHQECRRKESRAIILFPTQESSPRNIGRNEPASRCGIVMVHVLAVIMAVPTICQERIYMVLDEKELVSADWFDLTLWAATIPRATMEANHSVNQTIDFCLDATERLCTYIY